LSKLKQNGKVLVTSGELSKKGKATFDGMAVERAWGEANADFMAKFVKVMAAADADYRANPKAWTVDSPQVKANVKHSGAAAKDGPLPWPCTPTRPCRNRRRPPGSVAARRAAWRKPCWPRRNFSRAKARSTPWRPTTPNM
jgi:hypothetical protein